MMPEGRVYLQTVPGQPLPVQCGEDSGQILPTQQKKRPTRTFLILGICLIVLGALCMSINIAELVQHSYGLTVAVFGHGIWGGIMIAVAGSFTIPLRNPKASKCQSVTCMILNIIAAVFAGVVIAFSATVVVVRFGNMIFGLIMLCASFAAGILAIVTSALCCRFLCTDHSQPSLVILYAAAPPPNEGHLPQTFMQPGVSRPFVQSSQAQPFVQSGQAQPFFQMQASKDAPPAYGDIQHEKSSET